MLCSTQSPSRTEAKQAKHDPQTWQLGSRRLGSTEWVVSEHLTWLIFSYPSLGSIEGFVDGMQVVGFVCEL